MSLPVPKRSPNTYRRLIWLLVGLSLAGTFGRIWLGFQGCEGLFGDTFGPYLAGVGFLLLGILVVYRRPENRIGWLSALIGFQQVGLVAFVSSYAECGDALGLPGVPYAVWLNFFSAPFLLLTMFVLLPHLFPNGRFLTWRWGFAAWLGCGAFTLLQLLLALLPGPLVFSFLGAESTQPNPFGLPFLPPLRLAYYGLWLEYSVMLASVFIAIASLVIRWRRARGDERQQIKWFAFFLGAVVFVYVLLFELLLPTYLLPGLSEPALQMYDVIYVDVAVPIVFMGFPLVLAVTIFKYRLYDIDIIIRRTVSYAMLTGILAGMYFGGVVLLQNLFGSLSGNADSPLITVLSTLSIAALFNPLRTRIQDFIDRRFYRQKYDAEQALAQFASATRDEVDLDRLAGALLATVDQTMQPEQVNLMMMRQP